MTVRGIRGATTISTHDDAQVIAPEAILEAARTLMLAICQANLTLRPEDIASILFTVTPDLTAAYPARAARDLGPEWQAVPLMDALEIPVPGSLTRCIRVLLHWNTDLPQREIQHVYLGEAAQLRPDLAKTQG